jgi:hypothetical protein
MNKRSRNYHKHRRNRKMAMRLAIFLDAIGIQPVCEGQNWTEILANLSDQYRSQPVKLRREARVQGRMMIREEGLATVAAAIVSGPPPTPPKPRRLRTDT